MIIRCFKLLIFLIFYIKEVIKTNLIIAYEILTPTQYMHPGFIDIDISSLNDRQTLVFCNLLTMTPGSMVVGIAQDKSSITVHILYLDKPEDSIREIEESYLQKIKEIF